MSGAKGARGAAAPPAPRTHLHEDLHGALGDVQVAGAQVRPLVHGGGRVYEEEEDRHGPGRAPAGGLPAEEARRSPAARSALVALPELARTQLLFPEPPPAPCDQRARHWLAIIPTFAYSWRRARARGEGGGKGRRGVTAGARAPHLSHTQRSLRPSAGSPAPRSRGRPARSLTDRPLTVGAASNPAVCPRYLPVPVSESPRRHLAPPRRRLTSARADLHSWGVCRSCVLVPGSRAKPLRVRPVT